MMFEKVSYLLPLSHTHTHTHTHTHIYIYIIFISKGIDIILIKLPWLENSANTYMRHPEHCTAVSTLLGLISSARGVMVIVVGNGHGDMSSIPGRDWLHFT